MAYPYYQPYQPYYPQNYQQQNTTTGIIWVSGAQEAQMYPVAPNNAVALWEQSGKTVYLKSADATGKPTMRIYDIIERTETAQIKQESSEYKVADFALKSEIEPILTAIAALKKDIKALKKKEVENDDE